MDVQLTCHLTDDTDNFYFMINPYFPTPGMMDRIRADLDHLIRYYPSNQQTIAEKIRQIDPVDRPLIAANGSCEAIRILLRRHRGKKLVLVPNFNEWEMTDHLPMAHDAPFEVIADAVAAHDIKMVCICNPNNPTGFSAPMSRPLQTPFRTSDLPLISALSISRGKPFPPTRRERTSS